MYLIVRDVLLKHVSTGKQVKQSTDIRILKVNKVCIIYMCKFSERYNNVK